MKYIFMLALLFSSQFGFSQTVIGKWKPVSFSMDEYIKGNVKTDSLFISESIKDNFKGDKDPAASEEMMRMLGNGMMRKMKSTTEEYAEEGIYIETNTRTGRTTQSKYLFNPATNQLERTNELTGKKDVFSVSFSDGNMVLKTDLVSSFGKKGVLTVVYEKL